MGIPADAYWKSGSAPTFVSPAAECRHPSHLGRPLKPREERTQRRNPGGLVPIPQPSFCPWPERQPGGTLCGVRPLSQPSFCPWLKPCGVLAAAESAVKALIGSDSAVTMNAPNRNFLIGASFARFVSDQLRGTGLSSRQLT